MTYKQVTYLTPNTNIMYNLQDASLYLKKKELYW